MTDELLAHLLLRTELFQSIDPTLLAAFLPHFGFLNAERDEAVVVEGAPGDAWYVVLRGELQVTRAGPDGTLHELATLTRGDSFGEMALIDDSPRFATVTALGHCTLACLPQDALTALVEADTPGVARLLWAIARLLVRRQQESTQLLMDLTSPMDLDTQQQLRAIALGEAEHWGGLRLVGSED